MKPEAHAFKRLRARRLGMIRRASLWDADEYLLSVSGTTFFERYRRFYYRDIQSIVVQNGPRLGSIGGLVGLLWLTLTLSFTAIVPQMPRAGRWLWLGPVAWLAWLTYINMARSCKVFIHTAVSSEELPAIFRRRAAARVLPKIVEKIRAAQEDFETARDAGNPINAGVEQPASALAALEQDAPSVTSRLSAAVCFLVILGSAAFAYWYSNALLTPQLLVAAKVIFCLLNALEVLSGVWGLLKLRHSRMFISVRAFLIAGMVLLGIRTYALMILLLGLSVRSGTLSEAMDTVRIRNWVGTGDGVLSLAVSIAGLIAVMMTWQGDSRGAASKL